MPDTELLYKLTEGFSTQAKNTNRYWILLASASIFSFIAESKCDLIDLPFGLGSVSQIDFYSIIVFILSVLIIAFASAQLQAYRTRQLIQKLIEKETSNKSEYIDDFHIQDIFESIVTPTINRVGPIAQFAQGRNQFFGDKKPSKFWRLLSTSLYLILKMVSMMVIYLLPALALIESTSFFNQIGGSNNWYIPNFVYWIFIIVSFIVLFISFNSEIIFPN